MDTHITIKIDTDKNKISNKRIYLGMELIFAFMKLPHYLRHGSRNRGKFSRGEVGSRSSTKEAEAEEAMQETAWREVGRDPVERAHPGLRRDLQFPALCPRCAPSSRGIDGAEAKKPDGRGSEKGESSGASELGQGAAALENSGGARRCIQVICG